jgi:hypothetical protein
LVPAGAGVVWAWAETEVKTNIAASIGLMTLLKSIDATSIKHICWVETNGARVQNWVQEKCPA